MMLGPKIALPAALFTLGLVGCGGANKYKTCGMYCLDVREATVPVMFNRDTRGPAGRQIHARVQIAPWTPEVVNSSFQALGAPAEGEPCRRSVRS